jgi:hypothetical protein
LPFSFAAASSGMARPDDFDTAQRIIAPHDEHESFALTAATRPTQR